MNIVETKNEGLVKQYKITIPYETIDKEIIEELTSIQKGVSLPGFRKGKAPIKLIRTKYEDKILSDVIDDLVKKSYNQILNDYKLMPAIKPNINFGKLEKDKDFEVTIDMEVSPEFDDVDFSKLSVERYKVEVEAEELDKMIDEIRKNARELKPIENSENHKLQLGDVAVIDFTGRINGEEFEGGKGENHELEIGSKKFIDTFETQLIDKKKGDRIDVKVTFPENYHNKEFSGKEAVFDVTINDIKTYGDMPSIETVIEKMNTGIKTVEELKEKLKSMREEELASTAYTYSKKDLFDKLMDIIGDKEVPPSLLKKEEGELKSLEANEAISEDAKLDDLAKRRVLLGLFFIKIAQDNKITVTEKDLRNAVVKQARLFPGMESQIMELYSNSRPLLEQLENSLLEEKVTEFVMNKVSIKEISIGSKEFAEKL